jgi:hypothetical protein
MVTPATAAANTVTVVALLLLLTTYLLILLLRGSHRWNAFVGDLKVSLVAMSYGRIAGGGPSALLGRLSVFTSVIVLEVAVIVINAAVTANRNNKMVRPPSIDENIPLLVQNNEVSRFFPLEILSMTEGGFQSCIQVCYRRGFLLQAAAQTNEAPYPKQTHTHTHATPHALY